VIRVYRYGLRPPTENAELVREQMRLAHAYYNSLVEIERDRRTQVREVEQTLGNIAELETTAKAADVAALAKHAEIKATRSNARARAETAQQKADLAALRQDRKAALERLREARRLVHLASSAAEVEDVETATAEARKKAHAPGLTPEAARKAEKALKKAEAVAEAWRALSPTEKHKVEAAVVVLRRIEATSHENVKKARSESGVFWGTYLRVEQAIDQAKKMPLFDGTEPNDPRFRRWTREGSVSMQIQGGETAETICAGTDTRLRLVPSAPISKHGRRPSDPQSRRSALKSWATLYMRVGSEKRDPIWAAWPLRLHRPLPPGAIVKWADVHCHRVGPHEEWSVTFTLEMDADHRPSPATDLAIGVDLGWRIREAGIRVAAWHSEDGAAEEFVIPRAVFERITKADDLQSIRDKMFNAARAALLQDLAGLELPPWFAERTKTLSQWASCARLAALALHWRKERFNGDETAYYALEDWRYRDHHLWEWESHQRTKALRHRRELYRLFAAQMSRKYSHLVIEEFDLRPIARRKDESENETARRSRQRAAVSELRQALIHAFHSYEKVPAPMTTRDCHACGATNTWDQAAEVEHRCTACGVTWDQDANAAKNILDRRELPRKVKVARKRESKWAKVKRLSAEKKLREEAAHEAAPDAAE
jgi:hypothetical protein